MAEDKSAKEEESKEPSAEGEAPKPAKSKKKLFIIVGAVALVAVGGGGFFMMKGKKTDEHAAEGGEGEHAEHGETLDEHGQKVAEKQQEMDVFYDLEDFLVNLSTNAKQPSFLKMSITVQIKDELVAKTIESKMPLIRDSFQLYLRELTAEDLKGSQGLLRLKDELLLRLNKIMEPDKVDNILFKEILVQ